ncbi:MAG: polymerase, sigma-24 subunit, subfamily [Verrucomicrobia bacterium]|nr:polymerase, sigma-24 subunit, subfamily [Verrucomicrobiota bacterium]
MSTDPELLQRYADEHSEEAFAELVQRHVNLVYSAALRRVGGDAHLAKDVAQQVFTALARDARALADRSALAGWLYTATRNASAHVVRGERRRRVREQEAHFMQQLEAGDAPAGAEWERLRPLLDGAMDGLNDADREAVLLRFFEGRSFADIGASLRTSEDAARVRVTRALDKLHVMLGRRGVTSTVAALGVALANQAVAAAPAGLAASVTSAALAGTAGSGAIVAAKLLTFMSTTKIVSGTAGVIALLALGAAVYQSNQAREVAAALTAVSTERDALRTQLGTMEKRVAESNVRVASVEKELGEARTSADKPAEAPMASRAPSQGAAMDYVLEHPETHAPFVRQQELRVRARYDRFLKTAGLSAEQYELVIGELKGTLADELDFMGALRTQGLGVGNMPSDPEERARLEGFIREKKQTTQAKLRALLGEERFRQFAQYSSSIPERNVAEQIAGRLYDADEPLTAQQANQLAQILAQNRFTPQATPAPNATMNGTFLTPQDIGRRVAQVMQQQGMNMLDWTAPVTDAALAKARDVLTPVQLAALRQLQAQQLTQIQLAPPLPNAPAAANAGGGK